MNKTYQVLIGVVCLTVIIVGGWIGYSQYTAHQRTMQSKAFHDKLENGRQASWCKANADRLSGNFQKDMCYSIIKKENED